MTTSGSEPSTSIAVRIATREAREFHNKLMVEGIGGQLIMLITLGIMAFFDASVAWIIAFGLFLATGTITYILLQCALRFDAGRAYLEIWASDVLEILTRLDRKFG